MAVLVPCAQSRTHHPACWEQVLRSQVDRGWNRFLTVLVRAICQQLSASFSPEIRFTRYVA